MTQYSYHDFSKINVYDMSLVNLCVLKIAASLKECFWPIPFDSCSSYSIDNFIEKNPFSCLPSHIIEELISAVVQITPSRTLGVKDLYPLLTSGRIKNFKFEDVLLPTEEFVNILTTLSVCGQYLESLVLRKVYCTDYYSKLRTSKQQSLQSTAVECLLNMSPNLKHVAIDIKFDLKVTQKIHSLKHLELDFFPENKLYDLLPKNGFSFIPNNSITHLSIFESHRNVISVEEVAFLLKYFLELTCIEISIARALEYLHRKDVDCGLLTVRYKLQKCVLGSVFLNSSEAVASVTAIHIATVTCPSIKELDVLVSDHQAVTALCDFKNLNSLLIQWDNVIFADFRLGLQCLLENIGNQLYTLCILNFSNIDFAAIGALCPQLKLLKVEYDSEVHYYENLEGCFQDLETLRMDCVSGNGVSADTLILLLSSCKNLVSLCLDYIPHLTDGVLEKLLNKNTFYNLKEATLLDCSLTAEGLRNFIENCVSLEFLNFRSSVVSFEVAIALVHSINPFVVITTKTS